LLDAPLCSWSNCYSNNLAKSIGLALNDNNELISFDGTYWKQKANSSNYIKNHTIGGNSYTTSSNYALKCVNCQNWNNIVNLWYDNCQGGARGNSSAKNYCILKGMRLPSLSETSSKKSGGMNECGNDWTWTSSSRGGGKYWIWANSSYDSSDSSRYIRCVK